LRTKMPVLAEGKLVEGLDAGGGGSRGVVEDGPQDVAGRSAARREPWGRRCVLGVLGLGGWVVGFLVLWWLLRCGGS